MTENPGQSAPTSPPQASAATPDPLGLWAFTVGAFLGNLPDTGLVAHAGLTITVAVLLGGATQLLAGLQAFRVGSTFAATAFSAFGLFWIVIGLNDWLTGLHLLPSTDLTTLGWYLIAWTVFAVLLFGAALRLNRALAVTVGLSCFGLLAKAVGCFTGQIVSTRIGAWLLIACAATALYTTAAQFWNNAYQRTVLPLGKPAPHMR